MVHNEAIDSSLTSNLDSLEQAQTEIRCLNAKIFSLQKKCETNHLQFLINFSDTSTEAIFFLKDGFCLNTNQTAAKMFGWEKPDDLQGMFGTNVITKESYKVIKDDLLNNKPGPYNAIGKNKNGTLFPISLRTKMLPCINKDMVSAIIIRDLTDQQLIMKTIEKEQKTSQRYLNLAGVMFVAIDPTGKVTLVNYKACEVLEWPEADIIGKNWFDYCIPEQSRKTVKRIFKKIMSEELKDVEYFENAIITKSGKKRIIAWHNTILRNDMGIITGILSSGADVTQRNQALNDLETQHKQLLSILNAFDELVFIAEIESYELIYMNNTAIQIFGNQVRKKCYKVIHDLDSPCSFCTNKLISNEDINKNTVIEIKNKRNGKLYKLHQKKIRWTDGQFVKLILSTDITETKMAEETRLNLERQIQHAQKLESLGVLAGGIAHDFNNILMAILGNANLALMDLSTANPAYNNIKAIESASKRAADLAKQMLAYSGKGKFLIEKINLNEAVEEMTHILEVSISKKAVIKYHFADSIPLISADVTQIRQIIMNLVINASDAIERTSGVISITTGAMYCDSDYLKGTYINDTLDSKLYVFVEVCDTGCGMDDKTQKKLFDPFFTTKFTGRGLGLSAVLGIIRGHKGAIKVYSELHKGTSIKVLLPASTDNLTEKERKKDDAQYWTSSGTILLVDDEETILSVAQQMLEKMGFNVISAHDGKDAIMLFKENSNIALVILDLIMPHLNGEETFRELRRIKKDVKVLMCSGYNEQEVSERFAGKTLSGFLHKPYMFSELRNKVKEILE